MGVDEPASEESPRELALRAAGAVLEPVVTMLLDLGASCQDLTHLIRWTYVHQAAARQRRQGRKPSASRIAAATGLSRSDVRELLDESPLREASTAATDRACAQIVAGWKTDPDFIDSSGNPKILRYADSGGGFPALVKRYARDIPPRAMLSEALGARFIVEASPGEFLPSHQTPARAQSDKEALSNFASRLGPLAASLLRDVGLPARSERFDALLISDRVPQHKRARVGRDLERRCRTFSNAIERYLLDQTMDDDPAGPAVPASPQIGVLVACINADPASSATGPDSERHDADGRR